MDLLQREEVAALDPTRYGLVDPSAKYNIDGIIWDKAVGEQGTADEWWTLEDIVKRMRETYVGRVAYEYMHSPSKTERNWFSNMLEEHGFSDARRSAGMDEEGKKRIHELLAQSEVFDRFLQAKFPNLKRYGLEGGESMLPALDALFSVAAQGTPRSFYRHSGESE